MGVQENCLRENVRQFLSAVWPFIFLDDFGNTHHCRRPSGKEQQAWLLEVHTIQTCNEPEREEHDCWVVQSSPTSLELGHLSSTGLWSLEAPGQSSFPSYLCYVKLPFIWLYSYSLAPYERRKTYKMSLQRCIVVPSKIFFPCPSEFSSQN